MSFVNKTADYDCQLKGKSHLSEKGGTAIIIALLLVTASKGRFINKNRKSEANE